MQAFRVERELVTIPTEHASFPDRCLACGRPAQRTAPLKRKFGLDLMWTAFYRVVKLRVPVCNACWLRKKAAYLLALVPFAISLLKLVAVSNETDGSAVSPLGSPFDTWMKATFATGILAYYTARRFSERAGLGLRITKMSSGGALVTLRCKSTRDALEIAERTREVAESTRPAVAPSACVASVPAPAEAGPPGVLARYRNDPRKGARALLFVVGFAVLLEVMGRVFSYDTRVYSILFGLGALAMVPGVVSRKIVLTITRHGFVYARWGPRLVCWSELEWVTLLDPAPAFPGAPAFPLIEVQPKDPEAFRAALSRMGRLNSGAALARPQFAIDLGALDADADVVIAHFQRNVPAR